MDVKKAYIKKIKRTFLRKNLTKITIGIENTYKSEGTLGDLVRFQ